MYCLIIIRSADFHLYHIYIDHFNDLVFLSYISPYSQKNARSGHKTIPMARGDLTTPCLGEYPPRKHVTESSPAGGHVNTKHSSKLKEHKKHSQQQNYLELKWAARESRRKPALGMFFRIRSDILVKKSFDRLILLMTYPL